MIEKYYEALQKRENLRENLVELRNRMKDETVRKQFASLNGDGRLLLELLEEEDPKVRKNAAMILGELRLAGAADALVTAYEREQTLFVKSAYLKALAYLDITAYQERLKERMEELLSYTPAIEEKKHIDEEVRALGRLLEKAEDNKSHAFTGFKDPHEMLLLTGHTRTDVTLKEIGELPADIRRKTAKHPLGVAVYTKDVRAMANLRTYRELLFPIRLKQDEGQAEELADAIWQSGISDFLKECHKQDTPFRFRVEIRADMENDKRASFAKKFAIQLERASARWLTNSTGDYEIEIRLIKKKDGGFAPFLKLYTIPMRRFAYRKNAVAASIHPSLAAMLVALARPYLKENAQILDPFCGVGTMLIERDIIEPAREKYGIDIFGPAIEGARENASLAGEKINFIHRDYFDFRHDYLFDEIITNMPVRGKQSRGEMDTLYASFFEKSKEILAPGGTMIFYSNEEGIVKKQLRLHTEYRLIQEFVISEKRHFSLYIVGIKG